MQSVENFFEISEENKAKMNVADICSVCRNFPSLAARTWPNSLTDNQIKILIMSNENVKHNNSALRLKKLTEEHIHMLIERCAPTIAMSQLALTDRHVKCLVYQCPQDTLEWRKSLLTEAQIKLCEEEISKLPPMRRHLSKEQVAESASAPLCFDYSAT